MQNQNNSNFSSDYVISEDVIATIAINAATDVSGVAGLGNRPADFLLNMLESEALRHCKVTVSDYDIKVHLYLAFTSTAKIQDVAMEVQKKVKEAIQNTTNRLVTKVDITITGIDKEPAEKDDVPNIDIIEP